MDGTGGDLHGTPLIGWRLSDGEYLEIPTTAAEFGGEVSGYSPTTGLRLCFTSDGFRFQNPSTGEYLAGTIEDRRAYRELRAARERSELERLRETSRRLQEQIRRIEGRGGASQD